MSSIHSPPACPLVIKTAAIWLAQHISSLPGALKPRLHDEVVTVVAGAKPVIGSTLTHCTGLCRRHDAERHRVDRDREKDGKRGREEDRRDRDRDRKRSRDRDAGDVFKDRSKGGAPAARVRELYGDATK